MTPPLKSPPAPVAGNTIDVDPTAARLLWKALAELSDALRAIEKKLS